MPAGLDRWGLCSHSPPGRKATGKAALASGSQDRAHSLQRDKWALHQGGERVDSPALVHQVQGENPMLWVLWVQKTSLKQFVSPAVAQEGRKNARTASP